MSNLMMCTYRLDKSDGKRNDSDAGTQEFLGQNAGRYDRFMRKDRAAYDEMYELIRPVVRHKTVLELATGTGLIAKHIVNAAAHIEATDASRR